MEFANKKRRGHGGRLSIFLRIGSIASPQEEEKETLGSGLVCLGTKVRFSKLPERLSSRRHLILTQRFSLVHFTASNG